jgi:nitroreductase
MSDYLELATRRQSWRDYADTPVEREKLVRIVEAARLTPSACNSQPWKVVVVDDPAVAAEVAASTCQLGINEYIRKAKAFFVVLAQPAKLMPKIACLIDDQYFAKSDLGAFTYALALASESEGLGTCIVGMFDRPKLIELLKLPQGQPIHMVVAVGYPSKEQVRNKVRKPLEEIATFV